MNPAVSSPGPFVRQPWLRVSDVDRDHVVDVLQDAYAKGRLDETEFEARVEQALGARTFGELQLPLRELVLAEQPRMHATAVPMPSSGDRVASLVVHLSGYLTTFLAPLIVYLAEGRRPSYLKTQAAEAANFQLTFVLANIVLGLASVLVLPVILFPVIWVGWLILTFVGGVAGAAGSRFRYPLTLRILR